MVGVVRSLHASAVEVKLLSFMFPLIVPRLMETSLMENDYNDLVSAS